MKKYLTPNADIVMLLKDDIMNGSGEPYGLNVASGDADFGNNSKALYDGFWG